MITLVCTKCGNTLSVDDGFAGGVCRCNKCGTIQTVPKAGERVGRETIFERHSRNSGRELEAFGDIVSSSGLAGSGMLRQARGRSVFVDASRHRTRLAVLLGAAVALLAGGLWVALGLGHRPVKHDDAADVPPVASPKPSDARAAAPPAQTVAPSTPAKPSTFGPIQLKTAGVVVYVIDRGEATRPYANALEAAVLRSATSLGAAQSFQVRYWSVDGVAPAFPATPDSPSQPNLAKLASWMKQVDGGSTDAADTIDAALASKPAEIVLVTGKAWQLDDSFADESAAKLTAAKVRVDGVALGGSGGSEALARLAGRTGGTFIELDQAALERIGR